MYINQVLYLIGILLIMSHKFGLIPTSITQLLHATMSYQKVSTNLGSNSRFTDETNFESLHPKSR